GGAAGRSLTAVEARCAPVPAGSVEVPSAGVVSSPGRLRPRLRRYAQAPAPITSTPPPLPAIRASRASGSTGHLRGSGEAGDAARSAVSVGGFTRPPAPGGRCDAAPSASGAGGVPSIRSPCGLLVVPRRPQLRQCDREQYPEREQHGEDQEGDDCEGQVHAPYSALRGAHAVRRAVRRTPPRVRVTDQPSSGNQIAISRAADSSESEPCTRLRITGRSSSQAR